VTINSDDPPLVNTTLNQEAQLLHEPFGLAVAASDDILLNGIRSSFLDAERKRRLDATFRSVYARRKEDSLGASS
jgi:adenosine deaminase